MMNLYYFVILHIKKNQEFYLENKEDIDSIYSNVLLFSHFY